MAIRLKWKNPNTGSSTVRIYRSVSPIDTGALPAPIVEITDGSLSYLDEFPKYGESYYYLFSVTVAGRTVFTGNRLYSNLIDLGPGPTDLLIGDFRMGYFGKYTMAEIGLSTPMLYGGGSSFNSLYKIVRNGKILFTPAIPIQISITNLKNAKALTSGVTAARDPFAGAGGEIRDISGRLFAPRVAKLFDDANADLDLNNYGVFYYQTYTQPTNALTPQGKSELVDIYRMARVFTSTLPSPFTFGTDTTAYATGALLAGCDFLTSTTMPGISNVGNFSNSVTSVNFSSNAYFFPVIEYKGTV